MKRALIFSLMLLPGAAFAAGSNTDEAPEPTETTTECTDGQVWSEDAKKCVDPESDAMLDGDLYNAVRELAHAGRMQDSLRVLNAMSDQQDDRVLTYRGFVHRKLGNTDLGLAFYRKAIAQNPDNLLARSYMAQGFVEMGKRSAAWHQLAAIRARGGTGSWAEQSLHRALTTGETATY